MSDQWEKYVEQGTDALRAAGFVDPDDDTVPKYRGTNPIPVWVPAEDATRALLDVLGPVIAEDTRERLVAAAARAVERDAVDLKPLACPYCGGEIDVEVDPVSGYYGETIIDHIECQRFECGATWQRDGVALLKPRKLCGTCETSQRTADDLGGKVPAHDRIWGGKCPGDPA